MNTAILGIIDHSSMIGSHRWKKTGKIADFFGETHFEVEVKIKSPNPSQRNIAVLSIANLVQLAIRNQVVKLVLAM